LKINLFQDLMSMAQQKHKQPIIRDKKKDGVREAEFERMMTKEEKEEYIQRKASEKRKKGKMQPAAASASSSSPPAKPAATSPNHSRPGQY
jgi:hypothetical protein